MVSQLQVKKITLLKLKEMIFGRKGEQDPQLRQELNHQDESLRKLAQRAFKAASSDGRVIVRREPSGRSSCSR